MKRNSDYRVPFSVEKSRDFGIILMGTNIPVGRAIAVEILPQRKVHAHTVCDDGSVCAGIINKARRRRR